MKPTFDTNRALSWSAISSFEYDPEQWYKSYVLGIRTTSKEMEYGSLIDRKIQDDPTFLPNVPRYPAMQYAMKTTFSGIKLVGIADGYDPVKKQLADFKTGKKKWDQARANETGQLSMYCLLLYLIDKIKPEDMELFIHWIPTKEVGDFSIDMVDPNTIYTFKTKRTMKDILDFGARIKRVRNEMIAYAQSHS